MRVARSGGRLRHLLIGGWLPVAPPWLKVVIDLWLIAIGVGVLATLADNVQATWVMFPLWAVRLAYFSRSRRSRG